MKTAVVTGANRGLGLEFTKLLLEKGYKVFATTRKTDDFPVNHENLAVVELDMSSEESIKTAAQEISKQTDQLHLLINNAGVYDNSQGLEHVTSAKAANMYQINAIGPLQLTRELTPLLQKGESNVVAISSGSGQISREDPHQNYIYAMSKAALNIAFHSLAQDKTDDTKFKILIADPGWMHTDMGGDDAPIDPADSASKIISLVEVGDFESGAFLDTYGHPMEW